MSVPSTYQSITEISDFQHITPTEDMPSCDNCGQRSLKTKRLQHDSIHANVIDDVKEPMSKGYDERRAIKMALNKNGSVLEGMWDNKSDMVIAKMKTIVKSSRKPNWHHFHLV